MSDDHLRAELILIRHGKSSYPDGLADFDRPLSDRGRTELARLGLALSKLLTGPFHVFLSPAQRTEETWKHLVPFLDHESVERLPSLYEAPAEVILGALESLTSQGVRRVAIIGHNPGLEYACQRLIGYSLPMPTSTAVLLTRAQKDSWELSSYLRGRYLPEFP